MLKLGSSHRKCLSQPAAPRTAPSVPPSASPDRVAVAVEALLALADGPITRTELCALRAAWNGLITSIDRAAHRNDARMFLRQRDVERRAC